MSTTIQFRNHSERQSFTSIIVEAMSTDYTPSMASYLRAVQHFFVPLKKATLAAREYERLGHLSDAELNSHGLTREGLSHYISAKYLAN